MSKTVMIIVRGTCLKFTSVQSFVKLYSGLAGDLLRAVSIQIQVRTGRQVAVGLTSIIQCPRIHSV